MTLTDISIIGTEQVVSSSAPALTIVLVSLCAAFFLISIVLLCLDAKELPYICLGISLICGIIGIVAYKAGPDTTVYTIEIPDTIPYKEVVEEWDIQEIKYITNDSVICTAEKIDGE